MTVAETILVYAVIPLAIVGLFALLTLVPGRRKKARYKPGQQWEYPPVWWEPHPLNAPDAGSHGSEPLAIGSSAFPDPHALESGSAHGSTAHGASHVPVPSGPLGGARGTW